MCTTYPLLAGTGRLLPETERLHVEELVLSSYLIVSYPGLSVPDLVILGADLVLLGVGGTAQANLK